MHTFAAILEKFAEKGEKTGWTYVEVPIRVTESLKPGQKTSFRVKGTLDQHAVQQVALVPMGEGRFIMAINATMRRNIGKQNGQMVQVMIELDESDLPLSPNLMACLVDEPLAQTFFERLTPGHQRYFSNWIESAKTVDTKADRIAKAIRGLTMGLGYGETIRYFKKAR